MRGFIKVLDWNRNTGMIVPEVGPNIMFDLRIISGQEIYERDSVTYDVMHTPVGPRAINVQKISD